MHNRQSGAAHVPIMFFLILLVMFIGALTFAYVEMTRSGELEEKLKTATSEAELQKGARELRDHQIADVGLVLAKPGPYAGRPEVDKDAVYHGQSLDGVANVVNPTELKKALDDACANAGVPNARGIDNVLNSLVQKISQLNERVKTVEAERDKTITEKLEIDNRFQAAAAEASAKATEYKTNLDAAKAEFDNGLRERTSNITTLTQNVQDLNNQMATQREEFTSKEKGLTNEMNKLRMHNTALVQKDSLRNPPDVADGKVVGARSGIATAYINLGRKDMLTPGTVFRVRNPRSEQQKALAVVTRVEQERSEVSLSKVTDAIGDPVREGDLLYNELYTPGVKRTIYLMGRFSYPYNKPQLEQLLKNLGNSVVAKMGPGVDTVILGDDAVNEAQDGFDKVVESQEYKEAINLGVEFAPLLKIRDLIKL